MKNIFKISIILSAVALLVSCEALELEILDDPNVLNPSVADANLVLNDVQLSFNTVMNDFNNASGGVIRYRNQFGSYGNAVDNLTLSGNNGGWTQTYAASANINIIEGLSDNVFADDGIGLPVHLGMAHILEAYMYLTMVDFLGAVPYSQANNPEEFPTPQVDSGASIYEALFVQLDEAIEDLNNEDGTPVATDLFYDGDIDNWIALANSIKLKMYSQIRLIDANGAKTGINAILAGGSYIDTESEDFQFRYSTEQNLVESRHPFFRSGYLAGGAGGYNSNGLYDMMNVGNDQPPFIELGTPDPRSRYYFYRQKGGEPSGSDLPCDGDASYEYCYVGNFYTGRDHADEAGIPADGVRRSTYGLYPAGGAFDRNLFDQARANDETLEGAGIAPHHLASYTKFLLAETALTLGTTGNPASLLEEGIRASMDKVEGFANVDTEDPDDPSIDYEMTQAEVEAYVSSVMDEYNGADNNGKLNVIMREYYLAAYGNARVAYSNYRRTGFPDLQNPITSAGAFPRSYKYPTDEVDTNPNIVQNNLTDRVFWDNNPPGFID